MKIVLAILYLALIIGGSLLGSLGIGGRKFEQHIELLLVIGTLLILTGSILLYLTFGRSKKD